MTLVRGTDSIETQRLRLRRMTAGDLDCLVRIHSDPEVARYIGHGRPRSPAESHGWLQAVRGVSTMCLRRSDCPVGLDDPCGQ